MIRRRRFIATIVHRRRNIFVWTFVVVYFIAPTSPGERIPTFEAPAMVKRELVILTCWTQFENKRKDTAVNAISTFPHGTRETKPTRARPSARVLHTFRGDNSTTWRTCKVRRMWQIGRNYRGPWPICCQPMRSLGIIARSWHGSWRMGGQHRGQINKSEFRPGDWKSPSERFPRDHIDGYNYPWVERSESNVPLWYSSSRQRVDGRERVWCRRVSRGPEIASSACPRSTNFQFI